MAGGVEEIARKELAAETENLSKKFLTGILAITVLALWASSVNWIIEETNKGCSQYLEDLKAPPTVPPTPSTSAAPSDVPTHFPTTIGSSAIDWDEHNDTPVAFIGNPAIDRDDDNVIPIASHRHDDEEEDFERVMSHPVAAEMCKQWIRENFTSTNELVVLHNLTFGLVTAVVVAFLTRTNDNGRFSLHDIVIDGNLTWLKFRYWNLRLFSFILPRLYLFVWIWFGVKCLIRGSRRGEVFGPTLYATGHAWLGSAIAIIYTFFVSTEDGTDDPNDPDDPNNP